MKHFSTFEKKTNISFNNKDLLKQAFTHRSYINEHKNLNLEHNERLEFLGDAVLELASTDFLFSRFPDKTEGELTAFRSALVNTGSLSETAQKLSMNDYLLLSRGESKDTGRARQYILANTFEAFVGALYIDQGYAAARDFLIQALFPQVDDIVNKRLWQDAKSHFQEEAQERANITPSYKILKEQGPDHDKRFLVGVFLDDVEVASGEGRSKQEAEQEAAKNALAAKGWH